MTTERARFRRPEDERRRREEAPAPSELPPGLGNQALQHLPREQLARLTTLGNHATQQLARNNGEYPSEKGIEKLLTPEGSGTAIPQGYRKWLFPGGRVYMRDPKDPLKRLETGWSRLDGYDDLVKHATVNQGRGSAWVSTTLSLDIDPGYGQFMYEIELTGSQGIDVNAAVKVLNAGHQNPHFLQQEIAVYKRLPPEQISAIWVRRADPIKTKVGQIYGEPFANDYERYTPDQYRAARQRGEFAHIVQT